MPTLLLICHLSNYSSKNVKHLLVKYKYLLIFHVIYESKWRVLPFWTECQSIVRYSIVLFILDYWQYQLNVFMTLCRVIRLFSNHYRTLMNAFDFPLSVNLYPIVSAPYLGRHMRKQHCSYRSLGLAVALVRPVNGVGLQDPVQILLPAGTNKKKISSG